MVTDKVHQEWKYAPLRRRKWSHESTKKTPVKETGQKIAQGLVSGCFEEHSIRCNVARTTHRIRWGQDIFDHLLVSHVSFDHAKRLMIA